MSETIEQAAACAAATLRAIVEEVKAGRIEAGDRAIVARIEGAADALDAVAAGPG